MKQRLLKSIHASVEWRVLAFIITNLFLYAMSGELWQSTVLALELQAILFITHFAWFFLRETRETSSA